MPTLSSMRIPPPLSWEEFEELTLDSCKIRWENPDLQKNGRRGQAQNGVDIYGANHIFSMVGVQCKNYQSEITLEIIQDEIVKAESFIPKIEMFYFATTSKTDVAIQKAIRLLSQKRSFENKFPVMILFWEDIIQDLIKNPEVFRKHYPQINISSFSTPNPTDVKLYSILDLVYHTLNLNFHNELIFGEFGELTGEDPLQIQSSILTIKYSSNNVLNQENYEKMAKLIDEYNGYLFPKNERTVPFSWDKARLISNEFIAMVEGVEYNLPSKELAVFNIAKILTKWAIWEVENGDETWPKTSWQTLKKWIKNLGVDEIDTNIIEMEQNYFQVDHWARLRFPHKVYNSMRSLLMFLN
ncbi:hypothetical protein V1387_08770 [Allomuricauda taeanensis]|uniref:hypothetical protein n=1 Tax=Flagellimonas taeanensis TaxID=1005926 RepID=UPI002E7BC6F7|nr:hypothetical protein [Allomuricauda taeanensis]MEE1962773.1 hypothetical protein [Allomuricauda taeanensis]